MHVLLCDDIDSGKSTCCARLVHTLFKAGARMDGWITPPHMEHGCKAGHDFVAIECGRMAAPMPFTRRDAFAGSFQVRGSWIGDRGSEKPCPFHFSTEALERAAGIADRTLRITDLFVIDEIGPLELTLHRGFHAQMTAALAAAPSTLTVVRTEMRDLFLEANRAHRFDVYSLATNSSLEQSLLTSLQTAKSQ